jgi:hypothetical protein
MGKGPSAHRRPGSRLSNAIVAKAANQHGRCLATPAHPFSAPRTIRSTARLRCGPLQDSALLVPSAKELVGEGLDRVANAAYVLMVLDGPACLTALAVRFH